MSHDFFQDAVQTGTAWCQLDLPSLRGALHGGFSSRGLNIPWSIEQAMEEWGVTRFRRVRKRPPHRRHTQRLSNRVVREPVGTDTLYAPSTEHLYSAAADHHSEPNESAAWLAVDGPLPGDTREVFSLEPIDFEEVDRWNV